MATIGTTSAIDIKSVQQLSGTLQAVKLSDAQKAAFRKIQELAHTRPVNLENHPSQQAYAEVLVNGQSVAKVYNSGVMSTSNALYGKIGKLDSVKNPEGTGPLLAQQRADDIARALGGVVVKSATAITQAEWAKAPPIAYAVDYAALEKSLSAQTMFTAQALGQDSERAETVTEEKSVADEFLAFAEKSYEDKIYELMLKRLGLSEEDVARMSPAQRAQIEEKITDMIQAEIEKDTGIAPA